MTSKRSAQPCTYMANAHISSQESRSINTFILLVLRNILCPTYLSFKGEWGGEARTTLTRYIALPCYREEKTVKNELPHSAHQTEDGLFAFKKTIHSGTHLML